MSRILLIIFGVILLVLSGVMAWDSASLSAEFLDEQAGLPNLGYVIAIATVVLGTLVTDQFKTKSKWRVLVLVSMLGFMFSDGGTNIGSQWGKVVEARAAIDLRMKAENALKVISEEVDKLNTYKPALATALLLGNDKSIPRDNPEKMQALSDAQTILNVEGYPIPVDGTWGNKTKGAIETYTGWIKERLVKLEGKAEPHEKTLVDTKAALEFAMTPEQAIFNGAVLTLGSWTLSFIAGLLLSSGPKKKKPVAKVIRQHEDAVDTALDILAKRLRGTASLINEATAIVNGDGYYDLTGQLQLRDEKPANDAA